MATQIPEEAPIAQKRCHEVVPRARPSKPPLFFLRHECIIHQRVIQVPHGEDWESVPIVLHIAQGVPGSSAFPRPTSRKSKISAHDP